MVPGQQEVTSGPEQTEWDVQSSPNSPVTSTQNQSDHLLLRTVLSGKGGGGGEGEKLTVEEDKHLQMFEGKMILSSQ